MTDVTRITIKHAYIKLIKSKPNEKADCLAVRF